MKRASIIRAITGVAIFWMVASFVIVGLLLADVLSKPMFQNIFAGGFVIIALVFAGLSYLLAQAPLESTDSSDEPTSSTDALGED